MGLPISSGCWLDGIPLTLGLSDDIDVGLPVLVGFIFGCELGGVETLGLADGTDDGTATRKAAQRRGPLSHRCKDGSVDNDGCVEIEGYSDGRIRPSPDR